MASYRKKGKSWYFTVRVTDANGLRKSVERFGGDTRREAKQACLDFLAQCETTASGRCAKIGTMMYGDFLKDFYRVYIAPNLRQNTIELYQRIIDKVIVPNLGNCKLSMLTPITIQLTINELADKYSYSTMKLILHVIRKSLKEAVSFYNYIPSNPAQGVHLPKNAKEQHEKLKQDKKECFDIEEIKKIFLRFQIPHIFYAPTRIAWHTGMRLGECLALTWDNVDMENQVIHVERTLQDRHGIEFELPKTPNSKRIISFGQSLKTVLEHIKCYQNIQKQEFPQYYTDYNLVCAKSDGSVIRSDDMRFFGKWCHKELGGGSFHTLRHSHASYLLAQGWTIEDVSKRLGHRSVITTSSIYAHVNKDYLLKQVQMLDAIGL